MAPSPFPDCPTRFPVKPAGFPVWPTPFPDRPTGFPTAPLFFPHCPVSFPDGWSRFPDGRISAPISFCGFVARWLTNLTPRFSPLDSRSFLKHESQTVIARHLSHGLH
jgi:hypothetical protein